MRTLLLALLVLLLAPALQAQSGDGLAVRWHFDARIMFETVIDRTHPSAARVTLTVPDDAPAPLRVAFSRTSQPAGSAMIALTRADDGTYTGTGRLPAPDQIRAIRLVNEQGRIQIEVPAGWEEGVAAARYRVEPRGGSPVTGTLALSGEHACCPTVLGFNIGMPPTRR